MGRLSAESGTTESRASLLDSIEDEVGAVGIGRAVLGTFFEMYSYPLNAS